MQLGTPGASGVIASSKSNVFESVLPDVTLIYRIHSTNMTLGRTINEVALTQVLKRSLDRRRAAGALHDLGHWDDRGGARLD